MILPFPETTTKRSVPLTMIRDLVSIHTEERTQFIDITELVSERVRRADVSEGLVCLFTLHTTAALMIQEDEPFLLEDLKAQLARFAPDEETYLHNDLDARRRRPWIPMLADERENGASHARAMMLGASETLQIEQGRLLLGTWQRVFWVELDGPRKRSLSILILGAGRGGETNSPGSSTR